MSLKVCRDGSPSSKTLHRPGMSHAELLAEAARRVVEGYRKVDASWHYTLPEKYRSNK